MKRTVIVAAAGESSGVDFALQGLGYGVCRAASIRDVRIAIAEHPDPLAVFTDVALPDGNWRDLVDQVRVLRPGVPVILCTSNGTAELWWDALE